MGNNGNAHVVLVGHCNADIFLMRNALGRFLPGAEIVAVNDEKTLDEHRHAGAVWLINRELDGRFSSRRGLDIIEATASEDESAPAVLLISNYDDAQQEAESLGARPGFGKSALYDEETGRRLRAAAGA